MCKQDTQDSQCCAQDTLITSCLVNVEQTGMVHCQHTTKALGRRGEAMINALIACELATRTLDGLCVTSL
jgi:hypothetical protein